MKQFNLFKEIIIVDKAALLNAINTSKEFGITTKGEIKVSPFNGVDAFIYKGTIIKEAQSALMPTQPKSINQLIGDTYKIVEDDDRVLIKAAGAWQDIIGFNNKDCLYDDTTADGIAVFSDEELEDIGWNATEFNANYRDIVDAIEAKCEGTLLCIEQDEPYQFSGMGFIDNLECARKAAFEYCQKHVKNQIETHPDFILEKLTEDEEEAAEYFKAL